MDVQPSEPVVRLVADLGHVQATVPAELPGAVALADAKALLAALDVLRATTLDRIADIELRQLHALDGAPSTGTWVEQQPSAATREEVALARRLHRMPFVHEQVRAGVLSLRAAEKVGAALEKAARHVDRADGRIGEHPGEPVLANVVLDGVLQLVAEACGGFADDDPALAVLSAELTEIVQRPEGQLARLERAFVLLAQRVPRTMLAGALDRLLDALTPQRLQDRDARAHEDRGFKMVLKHDGSGFTVTRGDLTLELGEHLRAVLDAERATDPDSPLDTCAWAAPSGSADRPAPRSRAQQDHDALLLGLRRLLDSGALGVRGKVAPHLSVVVPLGALHDEPGALPAVSSAGTRLPGDLVRRLLCDSRLTRVVLGLGRRVVEVSHSERTAKAHERLALQVRWGGRCAEAGCTSPPGAPLVPHHTIPWHQVRQTALEETVPICHRTHHHLHSGRHTVRLRDGRLLDEQGWVRADAA